LRRRREKGRQRRRRPRPKRHRLYLNSTSQNQRKDALAVIRITRFWNILWCASFADDCAMNAARIPWMVTRKQLILFEIKRRQSHYVGKNTFDTFRKPMWCHPSAWSFVLSAIKRRTVQNQSNVRCQIVVVVIVFTRNMLVPLAKNPSMARAVDTLRL
jgi:hypothetical protein